ncbi:unnamed protein product [Linum trigynum]|uniref:Reverse transcriptase zinc-binding domain-containing protein n=1 Tax=Linum trigynum TaxID=586398 RepID=A0AAV2ER38_9ROSI
MRGGIRGLKLNRTCPTLTHCLFADDTVIFGEASSGEAGRILNILNDYGKITGQEVNKDKSSIFSSYNVSEEEKNSIIQAVGFTDTVTHSTYLGVPTEWGRSKRETFKFLLQRMESKGESWKSLLLSPGGKEILLKAVFQAIPSYIMSMFLLPRTTTKKMDSMLKMFFWGGNMTKKTIHWRAGHVLYAPKEEGGLGFRPFHTFNMALLAKQAWRLLTNPGALWVKVVKSIYFPKEDFLKAKKGSKASWVWASIWEAKCWMKQGVIRVIGNGLTTRMFHDPWRFDRPGPLTDNGYANVTVNAAFIDPIARQWRVDLQEQFLDPQEILLTRATPIGPSNMEDFWAWRESEKGDFSVKSAFHMFHNQTRGAQGAITPFPESTKDKWKWLWSLSIPPKLKFFVWRCAKNALAKKMNLFTRKCANSEACPLCNFPAESLHHCLFTCPHAATSWCHDWPDLSPPPPLTNILDWLVSLQARFHESSIQHMIFLMWQTWKARNERIFSGTLPSPPLTSFKAQSAHHQWNTCPKKIPDPPYQTQHTPPPEQTSPPPSIHEFEIHCDGSFFSEPQKAAYGVVVMNCHE